MVVLEIRVGDVFRLRKPHPCGGYEWRVYRTGADIGVACQTCGRRVMLPRSTFERRVKALVSRVEAPAVEEPGGSGEQL